MLVIDKPTFTRLAKAIRIGAEQNGFSGAHSLFLEAVAAGLGFADVNAATAHLKRTPIIIGVPIQTNPMTSEVVSSWGVCGDRASIQVAKLLQGRVPTSGGPHDIARSLYEVVKALGIDQQMMSTWENRRESLKWLAASAAAEACERSETGSDISHLFDYQRQHLKEWLDLHPMPNTSWAGQETLELAEQVSAAGEELHRLEERHQTMVALERGSLVQPDVMLDIPQMVKAMCSRLALRREGEVEFGLAPSWVKLWGEAFLSEVCGPSRTADALLEALRAVGLELADEPSFKTLAGRWSQADVVLLEFASRQMHNRSRYGFTLPDEDGADDAERRAERQTARP
jgi:hypothetical protein